MNCGLARILSAVRSLKLKAPSRFQDEGHPAKRLLKTHGMRLRQAPIEHDTYFSVADSVFAGISLLRFKPPVA